MQKQNIKQLYQDKSSKSSPLLEVYKVMSLDKLYDLLLKTPMDGEADLSVSKTKSGKTLYTIPTEHYSSKAMKLMHEKIRPNAEKNPDDWLFLVEGSRGPVEDIAEDTSEVTYAYMMGSKLGIPIEDPIESPYSKEVVEMAIKSGMDRDDVYLALSLGMLGTVKDLDKVVNGLSKMWDASPSSLERSIVSFSWEVYADPHKLETKKKVFKKIENQIIKISNDLSSHELYKIVANYPKKKNIFAYLGKSHKKILADFFIKQELFGKLKEKKLNNKLTERLASAIIEAYNGDDYSMNFDLRHADEQAEHEKADISNLVDRIEKIGHKNAIEPLLEEVRKEAKKSEDYIDIISINRLISKVEEYSRESGKDIPKEELSKIKLISYQKEISYKLGRAREFAEEAMDYRENGSSFEYRFAIKDVNYMEDELKFAVRYAKEIGQDVSKEVAEIRSLIPEDFLGFCKLPMF